MEKDVTDTYQIDDNLPKFFPPRVVGLYSEFSYPPVRPIRNDRVATQRAQSTQYEIPNGRAKNEYCANGAAVFQRRIFQKKWKSKQFAISSLWFCVRIVLFFILIFEKKFREIMTNREICADSYLSILT